MDIENPMIDSPNLFLNDYITRKKNNYLSIVGYFPVISFMTLMYSGVPGLREAIMYSVPSASVMVSKA